MTRVCLDAATIIYLVEASNPFYDLARQKVTAYRSTQDVTFITSLLSRLECRTKPTREQDAKLLADYDTFFSMSDVSMQPITVATIDIAIGLRARYKFATPDAIHLATAIEHHASVFLTGDAKLKRCTEMKIEILSLQGGSSPT